MADEIGDPLKRKPAEEITGCSARIVRPPDAPFTPASSGVKLALPAYAIEIVGPDLQQCVNFAMQIEAFLRTTKLPIPPDNGVR